LAKAVGDGASAEAGQISRWWQLQGDAFAGDDSLTGDEMGVYWVYDKSTEITN
jgi:hypothetical protein